MNDTPHLDRLLVGCVWAFFGAMLSSGIHDFGLGEVESVVLGMLSVPLLVVTVYIIGALGLWALKSLNALEVMK